MQFPFKCRKYSRTASALFYFAQWLDQKTRATLSKLKPITTQSRLVLWQFYDSQSKSTPSWTTDHLMHPRGSWFPAVYSSCILTDQYWQLFPSLSYQLMTRTQEHTEALPLQRAVQPKTPFPSPGYSKRICLCLISVLMCWISEGRLIDPALQRPSDNEDKVTRGSELP